MRATLTLDDDVAKLLQRACKERQSRLKQVVNDALRVGLTQTRAKTPDHRKPYKMKTYSCGKPLIDNVDNIAEVLEFLDGPDYR